MGFAEVIFPPFTAGNTEWRQDDAMAIRGIGTTEAAPDKHVILRRGLIGNLDLYKWWDKARRGKAPQRRTMKIELLSEDQSAVVLTWRFRNVRPVSLFYSPLRAIEGGIVMETVVLAFDSVEMS
jgi:phage tail-like protein